MEQTKKQYQRGFNNGYLLAEHEPELLKQLMTEKHPDNEYFEGLHMGRKEYEREKIREQMKAQNTNSKNKERDH